MKSNKKRLLSILTAFVMAFTVFGCTGLSFAEETTDQAQNVKLMSSDPDLDEVAAPEENEGTDVTLGETAEPEESASLMGVVERDSSSATISWDAVEPSDPALTVIYEVSAEPAVSGLPVKTDETTRTIEGLKANTSYIFTIKAFEFNEDTPEQEVLNVEPQRIEVETDVAPIAAPAAKASTNVYRAVTFKWGSVAAKNGGTISYALYTSDEETAEPFKEDLTVLYWKRSGFSPRAKTYTYYVRAVEKDADDNVIVKSDATKITGKPLDFSTRSLTGLISDPGYKAVLLQWNRIDGATGYRIYWRQGGERGNIDNVGKDSDGHTMVTFRSSKTRKYELVSKPGNYKYLTTVKNPASGTKVNFNKRGLKVLNHTYVYFYQFMIIPYYDDDEGSPIYTKNVPGTAYKSAAFNKKTTAVAGKSNPTKGIIRNNPVLPMYVLENAKVNKPIYKTCSMNDGKKRGRLSKGHKFICFDKANGRVKFYEKKNVSNPTDTFWFAQKNAHTIQGYYMNNGNKNNLSRKDWKTGYSKKTVLDFVNKSGLTSKTGYLIWASKYAQHVYIFTGKKGNWKLLNGGKTTGWNNKAIWSNLCTSGKVYIQSRNGNYVIFGKQHTAKRSKYTYYYLSKLHKTVRLHSLLHKKGQKFGGKLYSKELGNPVSKGCIRLRPKVSKWIYDKVPKKTRCKVW
jgi:hypothetical protein